MKKKKIIKIALPFVQQVVFRSLFHLEDEVPKVVHQHDSDVHSSVVPYLQCNNNKERRRKKLNKNKNYRVNGVNETKWVGQIIAKDEQQQRQWRRRRCNANSRTATRKKNAEIKIAATTTKEFSIKTLWSYYAMSIEFDVLWRERFNVAWSCPMSTCIWCVSSSYWHYLYAFLCSGCCSFIFISFV